MPRAKRLGRPPDWSLAEPLWEKCTDREIASAVGCTTPSVTTRRKRKKIPAFHKKTQHVMPDDLGVTPDAVIAEREGVSTYTVTSWRNNRGIPSPKAVPKHIKKARERARREHNTYDASRSKNPAWKEESVWKDRERSGLGNRQLQFVVAPSIVQRIRALKAAAGPMLKHGDLLRDALDEGLKVLERRAKVAR